MLLYGRNSMLFKGGTSDMSRFGMHREVINPPFGAAFIGYHREVGIASVHDPLYVTASIFESEQTTSIFVSIDNIGLLVADTNTIVKASRTG